MKFNKKTLRESLKQGSSGKKVYTEGKSQKIIMSEEQFDRLLSTLKETKGEEITQLIKESYVLIRESIKNEGINLNIDDYSEKLISESQDEWRGHNPGASAAAGIENIMGGIKKAYEMIKDSDTRKKLANSITKLGNFMTYTAELVGSGSSQRAPRSYDQLAKPLPHPEFEEDIDIEEEVDEQTTAADAGAFSAPLGFDTEDVREAKEKKERLIQEDIYKMKEVISPIAKSVLKETNSCKGLESDCDMNFVNKWLFPPRDGYGTTGQLTMVQWGGYDDKQRQILMDKAEKKSKGA